MSQNAKFACIFKTKHGDVKEILDSGQRGQHHIGTLMVGKVSETPN